MKEPTHLRLITRPPASAQGLGFGLQTKLLDLVSDTPLIRDQLVTLLLGIERSKAGSPPV